MKDPGEMVLQAQDENEESTAAKETAASMNDKPGTNNKPGARSGRVMIGGHFDPHVQTELKIIAAYERRTIQQLVGEALNLLFTSRGLPAIAHTN
jgi:hypothetical protein